MKSIRKILCVLLALMMVLALCSCGGKSGGETTPEPAPSGDKEPAKTDDGGKVSEQTDDGGAASQAADGGAAVETAAKPETVTIGVTGWLGRFLDGAEPSPNLTACDGVYDSLFLIDQSTAQPYSYILSDWGYEDELTFKMTLKDGITFANGDVATGSDLLFSVLQHIERGDISASSLGDLDLDNCKADGNVVTIKWKDAWGPGLTSRNIYLFDESWCREKGWDSYDWYEAPNGSGPFKVTEYVTDDHITLELRDDYWNAANEKFQVKKWIIKYYADQSTMYMALEKGEIAMAGLSSTDYTRLVNDTSSKLKIKTRAMGTTLNFFFGAVNNPIFQDKAVRQAIAHGVDWSAIGKLAYGDLYEPADSIVSTKSPFYKPQGVYEYNPDMAKQILADAGYKDGDIKIHLFEMNGAHKDFAEAFDYYCEAIGIQVDLEFGDVTTGLMTWMQDGGSDAGWYNNINGVANGDPHESLNCFYIKGFTWCWWYQPEVQERFLKAAHTTDEASRNEQYAELQKLAYDEYIIVPICECMSVIGYDPEVFSEAEMNAYTYTSAYTLLHALSW